MCVFLQLNESLNVAARVQSVTPIICSRGHCPKSLDAPHLSASLHGTWCTLVPKCQEGGGCSLSGSSQVNHSVAGEEMSSFEFFKMRYLIRTLKFGGGVMEVRVRAALWAAVPVRWATSTDVSLYSRRDQSRNVRERESESQPRQRPSFHCSSIRTGTLLVIQLVGWSLYFFRWQAGCFRFSTVWARRKSMDRFPCILSSQGTDFTKVCISLLHRQAGFMQRSSFER